MAKVSVIVPVYNMAGRLERCLESLAKQTLADIELVLVNDASTDDSYQHLLEFEKNHSENTIVVNCEENRGAGGARNAGLSYVSGEYIGFVDSDDYIKPEMFEELYIKAVSGNYDLVDSDVYLTQEDSVMEGIDESLCNKVLSSVERELAILSDGYIVSKLFKRELIENNQIRFREKAKLEDADFLLRVMLKVGTIGRIKKAFYIYDNADTGNCWSIKKASEKEYFQIIEVMKAYINILNSYKEARECRTAIEGSILSHYRAAVACCLAGGGQLSTENLKKLIAVRDIVKKNVLGGLNNPYFLQVVSEEDMEILNFLDTVTV